MKLNPLKYWRYYWRYGRCVPVHAVSSIRWIHVSIQKSMNFALFGVVFGAVKGLSALLCMWICMYSLQWWVLIYDLFRFFPPQLKICCFCSIEWLIVWCALLLPICYLFDKIDNSQRGTIHYAHPFTDIFNCSNDNKGHTRMKIRGASFVASSNIKPSAHVTHTYLGRQDL